MKKEGRKFLLDANVLIAAHRSYYAFDLCPGFWQSVLDGFAAQRIFSIQRIRAELLKGDALEQWVTDELSGEFFLDDSTAEIAAEYGPMMTWVATKGFLPAAQAKFAKDADGWLVATAKQTGFCLVTHEIRQEGAKARVPIPNLCDEFGVIPCNTFEMLRELGCAYR
jgi:predicted nucleic acid-binding protein